MYRRIHLALVAVAFLAAGCSKDKPDCKGAAVVCGDTCTNVLTDNANCGACRNACEAGTVCSSGTCEVNCAVGLVDCAGSCIDPDTDRDHCGVDAACAGGDVCVDGELCSAGACTQTCSSAQTACPVASPTYCADLTRDANNCGGCGTVCPVGQQCSGSACSCPAARPDACGTEATALCTDFDTDPLNCGGCGTICDPGQMCTAGTCAQTCSSVQATACPVAAPTYCADTQVDANNCGACGAVCPAGQQCSGGACSCPTTTPDACTAGGGAAFCTNKQTDPLNCGVCGTTCGAGTACSAGTCATSCPAGELACGGHCVDPQSDPNYCGATTCGNGSICLADQACRDGLCRDLACTNRFSSSATYATDGSPFAALIADVAGNANKDVAITSLSGAVDLYAGDGSGALGAKTACAVPGDAKGPVAVDLDGVNGLDIVTAHWNAHKVSVLLRNAGGTFSAAASYDSGQTTLAFVIDFDHDGVPDIGVGEKDNSRIGLYHNDGAGSLGGPVWYAAPGNVHAAVVLDLNADAYPDIVAAHDGAITTGLAIYFGKPDGTLTAPVLHSLPYARTDPYWGVLDLVAADFDGDGGADIAASVGGYVGVLMNNGDGTLTDPGTWIAADGNLAAGDINGDGKRDLVVSEWANNRIAVLLGRGNGSFAAAEFHATGNFPEYPAVGDLNGDGLADVVVPNRDDNTVSVMLSACRNN